jgi:hypothetical protein
MKHENSTATSRPALAIKTFFSGIALTALLGLSLNVQAQTCTVDNWDEQANLADANTGTQSGSNRRYGGPCGLRVALDGTPRYLTDLSPVGESSYIVRFYAFFSSVTNPTMIFAAENIDGDDVVEIWYNGGDLILNVVDSSTAVQDFTVAGIGAGWHSIELVWNASNEADNIRFSVNEEDDTLTATVDTSGISLHAANLGNLNSANGGSVDFDDFDSRRISRPGRLVCGDANNDGIVTADDVSAVRGEIFGVAFAAGQPDANEDGGITADDVSAVREIIFGLREC